MFLLANLKERLPSNLLQRKRRAPKSTKDESKSTLSTTNLYEDENARISIVFEPNVETSEKDTVSANVEIALKISAEVASSEIEKGNPIDTPNHTILESDKELGLKELNTAKDSTVNLSMNDPGADDKNVFDDSVQPST